MPNLKHPTKEQLRAGVAKLEKQIARRAKVNANARLRAGAAVKSFEELAGIAERKGSVFCEGSWGLLPAAAVMHMTAASLHYVISHGLVKTYAPRK